MNPERFEVIREAGEALLHAIFLEEACYWQIADKVEPENFALPSQQEIYRTCQQIAAKGEKIDLVSVGMALSAKADKSHYKNFIHTQYGDAFKTKFKVQYYADLLREHSLEKQLRRSMNQAQSKLMEKGHPIDAVYGLQLDLENMVQNIFKHDNKGLATVAQSFLDDMHKAKEREGQTGIDLFGIPELDRLAPGEEADLIIIAARPGQGKSSLQNSAIVNFINKGIPGLFWSLEMPNKRTYGRIVSALTKIPYNELAAGKWWESKQQDILQAIDKINDSKIFLEQQPGVHVMDIKARLSALKVKEDIKAVFVDRLGLLANLPGTSSMQKVNRIAETTKMIRTLAAEMEIPMIFHSQLNRQVESRPDKIPQLSDLRDSGAIEQDATKVIFLVRPEYYEQQGKSISGFEEWGTTKGMALAVVAKNTNGITGNLKMRFNAENMYFSSVDNIAIDYDSGGVVQYDAFGKVVNNDRNLNNLEQIPF